MLLENVVERSSSPISECPPDDEVGTLRSTNDSDDRMSNQENKNDGSPVSIFKSRMRQKDPEGFSQRDFGPVCQLAIRSLTCRVILSSVAWCSGGFFNSSETDIDAIADPIETPVNSEATRSFRNWYFLVDIYTV
jgi:hypothetical protein